MINTVLGEIDAKALGITLMHEHIVWDWKGSASESIHCIEDVVNTMLPYLIDLKKAGCDTMVEATTCGAGRDVEILRECSKRSGLNIITNVGVWDGGDEPCKYTPDFLKEKEIDEIVEIWLKEFYNGIGASKVKPGFIKLALGDTGDVTAFQEKLLKAAVKVSLNTRLPIQCHSFSSKSARKAVSIVEKADLPLEKFIWVHADGPEDLVTIKELALKGIWIELDCLARTEEFSWHREVIKELVQEEFTGQLLLSQDAGAFYFGDENDESTILPYTRIFDEFIPECINDGIPKAVFDEILIKNPLKILNLE